MYWILRLQMLFESQCAGSGSPADLSRTVGPNPCSFWHKMYGPDRVESTRSAISLVHEVLPPVNLVVLVKHIEVRRKHECRA